MTTSLNGASRDTLQETGAAAGRRNLWQLDTACRENLIGICLSPRELKELCRKLMIAAQLPGTDEFRRAIIDVSGTPSRAACRLHKYLDRKYWRTVLHFTGATSTTALAAIWRETDTSEVADACWALTTHPHANAWLIAQVHREAHDRTRQDGHAIRIDDQTLHLLQRANAAVASPPEEAIPATTIHMSEVGHLSGMSTRATTRNDGPTPSPTVAQQMESLLLRLRTQVEDYAAKLALERVRAERAEASAREWRQRAIFYEEQNRPRSATIDAAARRTRNLHRQTETLRTGRRLDLSGTA